MGRSNKENLIAQMEKGGGVPAAGQCERWATSVSPRITVSQRLICTVHSEPCGFIKRGTAGKVQRGTGISVSLSAGDFPERQAVSSVPQGYLPPGKTKTLSTLDLAFHMGQMWSFDPQVTLHR